MIHLIFQVPWSHAANTIQKKNHLLKWLNNSFKFYQTLMLTYIKRHGWCLVKDYVMIDFDYSFSQKGF
jgi:hypothetical protein